MGTTHIVLTDLDTVIADGVGAIGNMDAVFICPRPFDTWLTGGGGIFEEKATLPWLMTVSTASGETLYDRHEIPDSVGDIYTEESCMHYDGMNIVIGHDDVSLPGAKRIILRVVSTSGATVVDRAVAGGKTDVSFLSPGVYVAVAEADGMAVGLRKFTVR